MDNSQTINSSQPPKSILCIEDEFFIGELYNRALKSAGYTVLIEPNGQKALQLALSNNYDIILLDLMVPNIDGIEILRRLRNDKPDLKAKIVVTTNLEQSKANRAEIENQADGYIVKAEVTPRQLVDFLKNII